MAGLILKAPFYSPKSRTPNGKSRSGYINYVATREGVEILRSGMAGYVGERKGSNGLFSDEGEPIVMSKIAEEIDSHPGNMWGLILSLKREDAERLGYNSASQWINLLRSHRNDIAKEMHIAPENLRWYAAYHDKEEHPHAHMLVWSANPREPYLSRDGIHNIKKVLANDIFRHDMLSVYQKQTAYRDDLRREYRERMKRIGEEIREKSFDSPELEQLFLELAARLNTHKGKKVYGYLDRKSATPDKCTSDMPFGDWMDFWYQNYSKISLRPSTQAGYENHIYKHIIPSLGRIPLNKLTQNDLQVFYANLKKNGRVNRTEIYGEGLSDRSVRACHGCCRTALDKAVAEKLIRVNPAIGCKLPPKRGKEMQILTQDEMQRLLIQAREEGFYEMFLLDIATGMRRGELLALQWEDINFETGEVRINKQVQAVNGELIVSQPKTKSSNRTIILPPSMLKMLTEYRENVNSRWLFPSPVKEDSPRDPTSCRKRLSMILEHAGCKHVRFHDLRHLFSTQAIQYGMDVKTLAATIGHASVETTLNIYSHVTDEMQKNAAQKIDRAFGSRVPVQDEDRQDTSVEPPVTPKPTQPRFEPYKGIRRKPGTGCISQISETTWEGRYSPRVNGKKLTRNVYAGSLEECEVKLAEMIREMKVELGRV